VEAAAAAGILGAAKVVRALADVDFPAAGLVVERALLSAASPTGRLEVGQDLGSYATLGGGSGARLT
jgi:hypothetical protein